MSTINGRLGRLELRLAEAGRSGCAVCAAWPEYKVIFPDERPHDPHPVRCPTCGRERRVIEVQYVDPAPEGDS